jgi:hypothetical protein
VIPCAFCETPSPPRTGSAPIYCGDACRILDRVLITATGCAEWQGFVTDGYGRIQVGRVAMGAHRRAWEIFCGPIPPGLCVLHRCDNPRCVNPDHLFLGTDADNMRDAMLKGRKAVKIPTPTVEAALRSMTLGESQSSVAQRLGVDPSTVSRWKSRRAPERTWSR